MRNTPQTKPYAPRTVSVACRVTVEFERQLLAQAAEHQQSLSQYVARQLHRAASDQHELAELRREQRQQELRTHELEQQLARQQAQFAWYTGRIEQQVSGALKNRDCLHQLYQEYGSAPVPIAVATQLGFVTTYLLATTLIDKDLCYCVGEYSWRYTSQANTHFLIYHHGSSLR